MLRHCQEVEVVYGLIKRILQCCLTMNVGMCCGLLFMVSTVMRERGDVVVKGELKTLLEQKAFEKRLEAEASEEVKEEKKEEVKEEEEKEEEKEKKEEKEESEEENESDNDEVKDLDASFFEDDKKIEEVKEEPEEEEEKEGEEEEEKEEATPLSTPSPHPSHLVYQFAARDPGFSNASKSFFFELSLLCHHYHPTVAKFASLLLNNQPVQCGGDPLVDFSNKAFLDKFA